MGENSRIEWTHHTFNPVIGCTKVSPGCANCYAAVDSPARIARADGVELWGPNGTRKVKAQSGWAEPLRWDRAALKAGERHRVFCASQSDWLENRAEWIEPRARLLDVIAVTPNLDWLLLTKRPEDFRRRAWQSCVKVVDEMAFRWIDGIPPPNVWVGTSVENQDRADERIPHLLRIPAAVLFLSLEPLLGPVDITKWIGRPDPIMDRIRGYRYPSSVDWVIVGGESGPKARPMHPNWVRSIRDQCQAAKVPFFFKQWGGWTPGDVVPGGDLRRDIEAGVADFVRPVGEQDGHFRKGDVLMRKVGKKAAGRTLDGRTWDQFPKF